MSNFLKKVLSGCGGQFCLKEDGYTRSIQRQALLITLLQISMNGVNIFLKTMRY